MFIFIYSNEVKSEYTYHIYDIIYTPVIAVARDKHEPRACMHAAVFAQVRIWHANPDEPPTN